MLKEIIITILLVLCAIYTLVFLLVKKMGSITEIDEDEMTKTFDTMRKFEDKI